MPLIQPINSPSHPLIRRLVALLAALTVVTGCAAQPTVNPEEAEIVVLWHAFTGQEARAIEHLTDRFNAENPWSIILVTEYQEGLPEKLEEAPERRPDLVTLWPRDLQAYVAMETISAGPYTASEIRRIRGDLLPMAEDLYSLGGDVQAMPLGLMTYLLYYNEDWVRNLGYDFEDVNRDMLRSAACAATDPLERQEGMGMPAQADMLLAWLAAGGSQIVDESGTFSFADDPGKATMEWLHRMVEGGCARVHQDWIAGQELLGRGAMAMIVESSLNYPQVIDAVNRGQNFPIGTAPLPGTEGTGPTLWYGPGMLVTAPEAEKQVSALHVMSWFLSDEAQRIWGEMTDYIPIRQSTIETLLEREGTGDIEDTLERELWAVALDSAEGGSWVAWPHATYRRSCRASLLRSLLALGTENAVPVAYVNAAVTACNTGLRSLERTATPESSTAGGEP